MPADDTTPTPRAADAPQRMSMWEGYAPAIRSGAKRQTIRYRDPFRPGPAVIVFEGGDDREPDLPATVTGVRSCPRSELTEQDAARDGFASLAELQAALDRHYPDMPEGSTIDIVDVELADS